MSVIAFESKRSTTVGNDVVKAQHRSLLGAVESTRALVFTCDEFIHPEKLSCTSSQCIWLVIKQDKPHVNQLVK